MDSLKKTLVGIGVASAATIGAFQTAAEAELARRQTLVIYTGTVDAGSAERLLDLIGDSTDKIIGLKLIVERSKESDERYFTNLHEGRLNITEGDPLAGPRELIVNGGIGTTWDMWTVDGFYLIKSGGMHAAGALSYGAVPVDEADIRLNANTRLVEREF